MTSREAIETIKRAAAEVEWEYPMEYAAAFDVATRALEKQEPMHPIRTDDEWQCGNCKAPVGWDELQVYGIEKIKENYCSNCGRKVLWDE